MPRVYIDIEDGSPEDTDLRGAINLYTDDPSHPYMNMVLKNKSHERYASLAQQLGMRPMPARVNMALPAPNPLDRNPAGPGAPSQFEYWTAYYDYYRAVRVPGAVAPNERFGADVVRDFMGQGKYYDPHSQSIADAVASGSWTLAGEKSFFEGMRNAINSGSENVDLLNRFGWVAKTNAYFAR